MPEVSHDGERFPMLLIAWLPKPTGILTECTVNTNVSKALNLEFYCDTLSKTLHITSPDNWYFRLTLIPIGLSFWFTWFFIVIPSISLSSTSRNVCSKRSFTLARKCATGLLLSEGGIKRTISCLPTALYLPPVLSRNRVHYLESASHYFFLSLQ